MIRFLYRAGSRDTTEELERLIAADVAAGKRVVLLVPEQQAVSTEHRMLKLLPPSAQLSFEVLNFTRLANRVFRTVGGLRFHYATRGAQALVMWQALSQAAPLLTQYNPSLAKDIRFCDQMLSAKAQFKAYLVTPERLLEAAEDLDESDPLRAKLCDIGTVLAAEEGLFKGRFEDTADDLCELASILSKKGKELFGDTVFYIDSFTDFTAQQLSVIEGLIASSDSITFTTPLRDVRDRGIHLATATRTLERLRRLAAERGKEVFFDIPPKKSAEHALDILSRDLWRMDAEPAPLQFAAGEEISLSACPTPFAEAENAAAIVQSLVRGGARYRDIAIVMRDAGAWGGIIDAALEKEDIPYYLSEKTDLTLHPLIKMILFTFRIQKHGWREEDVLGYLKTGLTQALRDDINLFEEYANTWQLRGSACYKAPFCKNPDGYSLQKTPRGERILAAANRVREAIYPALSDFFACAEKAENATALCKALYDHLCALGIPERLKAQAEERLAAGNRREAEELARLWGIVVEAMETVSLVMGKEPMPLSEFSDALRLIFSYTDIGVIPTGADEVTVGSASMLRTDHPRFLIALGLNEGEFPRIVADTGLLSDAEKDKLSALGIELSAKTDAATSDELFYVYRTMSAPREHLYLSYSRSASDGKATAPSLAFERVKRLFPHIKEADFEAEDPLSRIYSPTVAAEHLPELSEARRLALLPLLEKRGVLSTAAFDRSITEKEASISPDMAQKLFSEKPLSPTQLESFSSCRFAYYCQKILKLREEPSNTIGVVDTGIFIHHVLEHVMGAIRDDKKRISDYTTDELDGMVGRICQGYRDELRLAGGGFSPRALSLFSRMSSLASLIVKSIAAELSKSSFTPAFFELDLARFGNRPIIRTENGDEIALNGKIDRVDYYRSEEGKSYLRVIDYKTGTKKFDINDLSKGFSLQMPLYLMALCREQQPALAEALGLPKDTVFKPAAVSYLSTAVGTENTPCMQHEDDAMESALHRLHREGVVLDDSGVRYAMSKIDDPEIVGGGRSTSQHLLSEEGFHDMFDVISKTVGDIKSQMKNGDAQADPKQKGDRMPCEYCPFGAICRAAQKAK